ncbi:Gfo/Idh/MocA family protein [Reichenbachiella ulvae]|uniref:Gfo/Idh/MocA family oxidoreductase n=1 Tax=Reichenbachiella ulvae TaxID=2980104 RepID=A0ABT3CT41_9BACT|nr:Gfo/Idh/MocA family oxidoreductase [Reichenbachiella ulvae]MCV9386679.1 Gfo/Idh/MocA family oxidoreductase [Reichenbachiella ulvae]
MKSSRRKFLRLTATSAAAVSIGIHACSSKKEFTLEEVADSERLKVGVIGTGIRGKNIIQVLNYVPEMKVVAICDTLDFRLKEASDLIKHKVVNYTDYQKLLAHDGLDAVIIASPLHEHYRMVMSALDANLHILCEKALAYSIEQCREIKIRGDQYDKVFQVSYQYQLNPVFEAIKNLVDKGYLGKITKVEASWDRHGDWRRKVPSSELERQINWRMYREYSGGLMAELGSHQLNMVDSLLGAHPIRVVGTGGIDYWKDGRTTFDNVHALFDYPEGVKVGFHSGTTNKYEGYQMKFYGDKATVVSHGMNTAEIFPEGDRIEEEWSSTVDGVSGASIKIIGDTNKRKVEPIGDDGVVYPSKNDNFNMTWKLYKNFAAAIRGKEKLLLGLKDAYQSAISVHMANDAIRNGKVVDWRPEFDI